MLSPSSVPILSTGTGLSALAVGLACSWVLPAPSWLACARYSARSGSRTLGSGSATIVTSREIASRNSSLSTALKVTPIIRMPWTSAARNSIGGSRSGTGSDSSTTSSIESSSIPSSKLAVVEAFLVISQAGGPPETPDFRILAQEINDLWTLVRGIYSTETWITFV